MGHALETLSKYSLSHGEAVAIGIPGVLLEFGRYPESGNLGGDAGFKLDKLNIGSHL